VKFILQPDGSVLRIVEASDGPEFWRADGSAICPTCERSFRDHPVSADYDFLHVLCNGELVKL